ncbi:DNA methyltransferase [Helicobacter sp. L8]|uniref:DNA methyltransferase n=1 Tax=Helicobacter sp. L8 TaxID=2316078 RepID=UPI001F09F4C0|nr:DNA methyltransferase [Helicobacter sp. L8]
MLRYCLKIVPSGGVVLDCFAGSGSTGVACVDLGLHFIGVEKSAEYARIARENLKKALAHPPLKFESAQVKVLYTHSAGGYLGSKTL